MPIARDVVLGENASIAHPELVNLYGCTIGAGTRIGPFVEIQRNAVVGARCKLSSHSFICEGVIIEDEVFIGHGVVFTNDIFPKAVNDAGELKDSSDWTCIPTRVCRGAAIGSNATILAGITIGAGALIGAGSVVTQNVSAGMIVAGVPARPVRSKS
jgi:UDP-2-acetamido-3-amino-2,3-dideoxy-glucuronate N-acetyltransferase